MYWAGQEWPNFFYCKIDYSRAVIVQGYTLQFHMHANTAPIPNQIKIIIIMRFVSNL